MASLGWLRAPFAEDYAAERRERVLRRRLQDGLLHGAGTVWGLAAAAGDQQKNGVRTRVVVRPGLAIDALGREIYVDREQYLDVEGLVSHAIWNELLAPDGSPAGAVRRAYIVLRHEACQVEVLRALAGHYHRPPPVPRALDTFRIELSPTPPPDPRALRRECFAAFAGGAQEEVSIDPRRALLLQERAPEAPAPPSHCVGTDGAPLLLATLDLGVSGTGAAAMAFVVDDAAQRPNPDNRVRASVPGTQVMADTLFGGRLSGRS
jgi:hypothetical protein